MTSTTPKANTKADLHMKLQSALQLNSYLVSRLTLARGLGKSFDGDRDLYQVFGYPLNPDYNIYLNCYERDGIATRVVDAAPNETWRKHPILYVGNEAPSEDEPGALQEKFNEFCNEHDLWAAFNDLDKACGISRFGLLFLGVPGELEQPAQKGKLAYVTVHDEGNAEVDEMSIIQDPTNPRFGLPEYYQIVVDDKTNAKRRVHYSRVLHYKDGRDRSGLGRVYGVPRLKNVINRLYDLEKVVGGGSEAFWLLIRKGLALIAKEGMSLPDKGTDEYADLQDEIDEFNHGLKRYMRLVGMDIKDLGAEPVDSREQFDVIIEYIAGSEGIPQRILLGSERGELASGQDETNWEKVIDWRRRNKAEPYILRPFLKMAKTLGFFNVPDNYKVFWPPLTQLSETQDASVAVQIAGAVSTITGGAPEVAYPAEEFIARLPGKWRFVPTAEQAAEMEEKKRQPDEANIGGDKDKDKDAPEKDEIEVLLKKVKEKGAIANQGVIGATLLNKIKMVLQGGPGSGYHKPEHKGRPGEIGGSLPADEATNKTLKDKASEVSRTDIDKFIREEGRQGRHVFARYTSNIDGDFERGWSGWMGARHEKPEDIVMATVEQTPIEEISDALDFSLRDMKSSDGENLYPSEILDKLYQESDYSDWDEFIAAQNEKLIESGLVGYDKYSKEYAMIDRTGGGGISSYLLEGKDYHLPKGTPTGSGVQARGDYKLLGHYDVDERGVGWYVFSAKDYGIEG